MAAEGASGSPCLALGPDADRLMRLAKGETPARPGKPAPDLPVVRPVFEACVGKMVDVLLGERAGDFYNVPNPWDAHDHVRELWRGILTEPVKGLVAEGCIVLRHLGNVALTNAWVYELSSQGVGASWQASSHDVEAQIEPNIVVCMRPSLSWDNRFRAQNQLMRGAFLK